MPDLTEAIHEIVAAQRRANDSLLRKLLRHRTPPEPLASPKRDESGGVTVGGL